MTLTLEERSHIHLCIAVVCDVTPSAGFRGVTLTIFTRTSSSQSSNAHFTFICAGAVSDMLLVSANVLCNRANKHRSGCPLGTCCPNPASQHSSLRSTAVSGQTNHQNPLSFTQWRGVRRQKRFSIPPELCFVCIRHVDGRTWSIPTRRRLKLQATPSMFIQAVKHSTGPPTSLKDSVQHLTHKAVLATAVQPCMWKQQVLRTGFISSFPAGRQRLLLVIVLAKGFLFFSLLKYQVSFRCVLFFLCIYLWFRVNTQSWLLLNSDEPSFLILKTNKKIIWQKHLVSSFDATKVGKDHFSEFLLEKLTSLDLVNIWMKNRAIKHFYHCFLSWIRSIGRI